MTACALHSYWSLAGILLAVSTVSWFAGWLARLVVAESLEGGE